MVKEKFVCLNRTCEKVFYKKIKFVDINTLNINCPKCKWKAKMFNVPIIFKYNPVNLFNIKV